MGTMRMGVDPASSVLDPFGRLHAVDNLYFADGSGFVSAGGFNPTLTIMALALRTARALSGGGPPSAAAAASRRSALPATGDADGPARAVAGAAAVAAAAALGRARQTPVTGS
jgi:LPXTG-motif cell wall-anchored protein